MIGAGVVAGLLVAGGLLLVAYGIRPPAPRLAALLAEYDAALHTPTLTTPRGSRGERLIGQPMAAAFDNRGWFGARQRADLQLLRISRDRFFATKTAYGLIGALTPTLLVAAAELAGASIPILIPAWAFLAGAVVGFLVPDLQVRSAANDARRNFRVAVSAYLDLVAMRMASGAGLSEALTDAARIGAGPAFAAFRGALADARTDGLTPNAALGRLGQQLGVAELVDTAARLSLVDTSGAQAEASLRAQAATLRDRDLSDLRGSANERSQSMLVAQVVLGFGFLLFLGYPAVAKVLAA